MKLGGYNQKIQFIHEGQVPDGYGGCMPSDVVDLETFARIEQLPQSRSIEQVQMKLPSTYRVGVQARSGFYPSVNNMVKWRGEKYSIITSPVVENVRLNQEWIFDICQL